MIAKPVLVSGPSGVGAPFEFAEVEPDLLSEEGDIGQCARLRGHVEVQGEQIRGARGVDENRYVGVAQGVAERGGRPVTARSDNTVERGSVDDERLQRAGPVAEPERHLGAVGAQRAHEVVEAGVSTA